MKNLKGINRRLFIGLTACGLLLVMSLAGNGVAIFHGRQEGDLADRLTSENEELKTQLASLREQADSLQAQLGALSEQADEWAAEKEELTAQLEEAKKKAVQLEQQLVSKGIAPEVPTASVTAAGDVVLQFAKPEYTAETKLIALTFDDGPGKYTDRLLD